VAAKRVRLTNARIRKLKCDSSRVDCIFWDSEAAGLGVRVQGSRATFIFQFRYQGKSGRMAIGSVLTWDIEDARIEARRLRTLLDLGEDPRGAKKVAASRGVEPVTFRRAWEHYVDARREFWGASHLRDHTVAVQEPGLPRKRSKKTTIAGGLYGFLDLPLQEITIQKLEDWVRKENQSRPVVAARNYRILKAFLNWASESEEYADLVPAGVLASSRISQLVRKPAPRGDVLHRGQLVSWFAEVQKIKDPVVATLVQVLLLTGARKEEVLGLRWEDLDFRWKTLKVRDKAESHGGRIGHRVLPMTPYVEKIFEILPRRNAWVFSSTKSSSGRMIDPRVQYARALQQAGIKGLTLHGLRRSFGTLSEWVEAPAGVIAQIMGHKPSAIAEKHYRVRSVDLLRLWHERIEAWILMEAGLDPVSGA
jgi:integrase